MCLPTTFQDGTPRIPWELLQIYSPQDTASLARREALLKYGLTFKAHPGKQMEAQQRVINDFLNHVRITEWRDHRDNGMSYSIYEFTLGAHIIGYFKKLDPTDKKGAKWWRKKSKAILWGGMCKSGDQYHFTSLLPLANIWCIGHICDRCTSCAFGVV